DAWAELCCESDGRERWCRSMPAGALVTWGVSDADVVLAQGGNHLELRGGELWVLASADRGTIATPSVGPGTTSPLPAWAHVGELVIIGWPGRFRGPARLEPATLRAVDLRDGSTRWSVPIETESVELRVVGTGVVLLTQGEAFDVDLGTG